MLGSAGVSALIRPRSELARQLRRQPAAAAAQWSATAGLHLQQAVQQVVVPSCHCDSLAARWVARALFPAQAELPSKLASFASIWLLHCCCLLQHLLQNGLAHGLCCEKEHNAPLGALRFGFWSLPRPDLPSRARRPSSQAGSRAAPQTPLAPQEIESSRA